MLILVANTQAKMESFNTALTKLALPTYEGNPIFRTTSDLVDIYKHNSQDVWAVVAQDIDDGMLQQGKDFILALRDPLIPPVNNLAELATVVIGTYNYPNADFLTDFTLI